MEMEEKVYFLILEGKTYFLEKGGKRNVGNKRVICKERESLTAGNGAIWESGS